MKIYHVDVDTSARPRVFDGIGIEVGPKTGTLYILGDDGIVAAFAPGRWESVREVTTDDDPEPAA